MTTNNGKAKKNEVVEQKGGAVAAYDYGQYAGQGFEAHTSEDYATPFLGLLQSNSPICETLAGAKAGKMMNTVTQDIYDGEEGIVFIPATTDHMFVEWVPRNLGGGFVSIHGLDSDIVKKAKAEQEFGKYKMVKGDLKSNDLIETFYVYGIRVNESGGPEPMIIAFSSTKIKVYKRWMSKARTIQIALPSGQRISPPLFAHKYRMTTIQEKNADGSFYNFQVGFDGEKAENCRLETTDPLFLAAVAFAEQMKSGKVKAAYDSQNQTGEATEAMPFK